MTGILFALALVVVAGAVIYFATRKTPPTPDDPNATTGSSTKTPESK